MDFTLRIYAPQLEQAAAPSSPILPEIGTPAATTRATETVTGLTTVSRSSRKSNAGEWDFTNGGSVGAFREYLRDVPAVTGKGLLVEEATTNLVPNPRCEGAVAGTPGTRPTGWPVVFTSAGTLTTHGNGYENGWPYLEAEHTHSAASVSLWVVENNVPASAGQVFTASSGFKLISGSGGVECIIIMIPKDSGGTPIAEYQLAFAPDAAHRRHFLTSTMPSGTATVELQVRIGLTSSGANRSRIYAPQLEQKAYPTSPILPPKGNPGAATRAADLTTVAVGSWANADEYTVYVEMDLGILPSSGPRRIAALDDGSTINRTALNLLDTGVVQAFGVSGGAVTLSELSTAYTVSDIIKVATAIKSDDAAVSFNGSTQGTNTSAGVPVGLTVLRIGGWSNGGVEQPIGSYIKQVRYFPRRLTNAELETLVGN